MTFLSLTILLVQDSLEIQVSSGDGGLAFEDID